MPNLRMVRQREVSVVTRYFTAVRDILDLATGAYFRERRSDSPRPNTGSSSQTQIGASTHSLIAGCASSSGQVETDIGFCVL